MWTFFEDGTFYSAVVNRDDSTQMVVRTRDKRSADILADALDRTPTNEKGDYAYRVWCSRDEWQSFVDAHIQSAKATNFKSEVGRNIGYKEGKKWLDALHDIWAVMWDLQHNLANPSKKSASASAAVFENSPGWAIEEPVEIDGEAWNSYEEWEEAMRNNPGSRNSNA